MTNHPNRSKFTAQNGNKVLAICPRGFANEVNYYLVTPAEREAVERYLDGRKDREFDLGNTHWDWWWAEVAEKARVAVPWADAGL